MTTPTEPDLDLIAQRISMRPRPLINRFAIPIHGTSCSVSSKGVAN